jgi:hypothetical protein
VANLGIAPGIRLSGNQALKAPVSSGGDFSIPDISLVEINTVRAQ